jgi:long-chain acyl-CoA synthetase
VREFSLPALAEIPATANLASTVFRRAAEQPQAVVLRRPGAQGSWTDVTASQFRDEVVALAKGLVAAGVAAGDRVALMSHTRYEWTLIDYAIWTAGAVTVPVYETSSAEQTEWILSDSGASACFAETAALEDMIGGLRDRLPGLAQVWRIDPGSSGSALDALRAAGADVGDEVITERSAVAKAADLATVIYTSGTTGRPKGCELTHANLLADVRNAFHGPLAQVMEIPDTGTLLFLPLAHVFARIIQVGCLEGGVVLGHCGDLNALLPALASFRPTFILAVPRVFEKIYNSAEQKAAAEGRGRIFASAAETAITWSRAHDDGRPGPLLRLRHAMFERLVYRRLRAAMGGRVQYAVSGGGPLGVRLGHFYRGIGLTVLEGYGLTETTAPATVNTPAAIKIGTVGPPLPGVAIRIADDGEVLVKGNNVFTRYRNNETATHEAFVDGWFRTGDIGELDDDGFLRITGRKKELLVTAGGKNVAPAVLEDRLRAHPLVSQCIVVGDQKPFIAALVTLDAEMLPAWTRNHGLGELTVDQARDHEVVLAEVQKAVDEANKAVSRAESIRKFAILPGDFTEDNGYLTPSMKLKRTNVMKDYSDQVEALYSGPRE